MSSPLRLLAIIASPRGETQFVAEAAWRDLSDAVKPLLTQGLLELEQLKPATENALKKRLASAPCDVVHFIGYTKWRAAVQYGTLLLESSTGEARSVSSRYFGEILEPVRLVVLQTNASGNAWDDGPALLINEGPLVESSQVLFARSFYANLANGSTLQDATAHARAALASAGAVRTLILRGSDRIVPPRITIAAPPVPTVAVAVAPDPAASELQRKRAAGEFDVFLCHNSADKPRVRELAGRLESQGILPWLDERELPPGQPWQPLLEQQIASIRTAAVLLGAAGVGPWQEQELYSFLREFVDRKSPVIPVILQDAPDKPHLPRFLRGMTWVDFRVAEPEPLSRLIWAITGRRPE